MTFVHPSVQGDDDGDAGVSFIHTFVHDDGDDCDDDDDECRLPTSQRSTSRKPTLSNSSQSSDRHRNSDCIADNALSLSWHATRPKSWNRKCFVQPSCANKKHRKHVTPTLS